MTISSISKPLSNIEIYDVSGKQIMTIHGNGKSLKQIDVTHLSSGIYFIKINDIGQAKFIIK